jgi:hypothetical protein
MGLGGGIGEVAKGGRRGHNTGRAGEVPSVAYAIPEDFTALVCVGLIFFKE